MVCIVESTLESIQKILRSFGTYITTIVFIPVIILTNIIKINNYIFYDIRYINLTTIYSTIQKLIIVHHITIVLVVNLPSKRMYNSCALLCQNSTPRYQSTFNGTCNISAIC